MGSPTTVNAHLENTTNDQCFKPHRKIPTSWGDRVGDVLERRIVNNSDNIVHTFYRSGVQECVEAPPYDQNGNRLSQWGALARANSNTSNCGGDETWQNIDEYYYTYDVVMGSDPSNPNTGHHQINGGIRLEFNTPGAWKYEIQAYFSGPDAGWYVIKKLGWGNKVLGTLERSSTTQRTPAGLTA